jgi:two-component system sensor histidine kinase TctE
LARHHSHAAAVFGAGRFLRRRFREEPVRVAVLLQPVASANGRAMAVVQVAETLELRKTLARKILFDTLWRQAILLAVIALVAVVVVQRATRPVRRLSAELQGRHEGDLTAIPRPTRRANCCRSSRRPTR